MIAIICAQIHYVGWTKRFDEWVGVSRLRASAADATAGDEEGEALEEWDELEDLDFSGGAVAASNDDDSD